MLKNIPFAIDSYLYISARTSIAGTIRSLHQPDRPRVTCPNNSGMMQLAIATSVCQSSALFNPAWHLGLMAGEAIDGANISPFVKAVIMHGT